MEGVDWGSLLTLSKPCKEAKRRKRAFDEATPSTGSGTGSGTTSCWNYPQPPLKLPRSACKQKTKNSRIKILSGIAPKPTWGASAISPTLSPRADAAVTCVDAERARSRSRSRSPAPLCDTHEFLRRYGASEVTGAPAPGTFEDRPVQSIVDILTAPCDIDRRPVILVVGEEDTGRRTATRMACDRAGYHVHEHSVISGLGIDHHLQTIAKLLLTRKVLLSDRPCVLMLNITPFIIAQDDDVRRSWKETRSADGGGGGGGGGGSGTDSSARGAFIRWLRDEESIRRMPLILIASTAVRITRIQCLPHVYRVRVLPPTPQMLFRVASLAVEGESTPRPGSGGSERQPAVSAKDVQTAAFGDQVSRIASQGVGGYTRVLTDTWMEILMIRNKDMLQSSLEGMHAKDSVAPATTVFAAFGVSMAADTTTTSILTLTSLLPELHPFAWTNYMVGAFSCSRATEASVHAATALLASPDDLHYPSFEPPGLIAITCRDPWYEIASIDACASISDTFSVADVMSGVNWRSRGIYNDIGVLGARTVRLRSTPDLFSMVHRPFDSRLVADRGSQFHSAGKHNASTLRMYASRPENRVNGRRMDDDVARISMKVDELYGRRTAPGTVGSAGSRIPVTRSSAAYTGTSVEGSDDGAVGQDEHCEPDGHNSDRRRAFWRLFARGY